MGGRLIARSAAIGDRALDLGRCVGLLVVLLAALALAGAASAAGAPAQRSPTLLWKTYPLVQRPAFVEYRPPVLAAGAPLTLPLQAQAGRNGMFTRTMLLLLLGSLVAAVAGLLMVRSAFAELRDDAELSERR